MVVVIAGAAILLSGGTAAAPMAAMGSVGANPVAVAVGAGATATGGGATATGGTVAVVVSGPAVWGLVIGAAENASGFTYDCWKPVLRDESPEPSKGRLLMELAADPRVKTVTVEEKEEEMLPEITLENVWGERFRLDFVLLSPSNILAAHATLLE